jgi:hypothetical protein
LAGSYQRLQRYWSKSPSVNPDIILARHRLGFRVRVTMKVDWFAAHLVPGPEGVVAKYQQVALDEKFLVNVEHSTIRALSSVASLSLLPIRNCRSN